MALPSGLKVLEQPLLLWASGGMFALEFFADKIPGVDTVWDVVHTFVRIPAGAALAAGVFGSDQAVVGHRRGAAGRHARRHEPHRQGHHAGGGQHAARTVHELRALPVRRWCVFRSCCGSRGAPAALFVALGVALVVMVTLVWVFFRFLRALVARSRRGDTPVH